MGDPTTDFSTPGVDDQTPSISGERLLLYEPAANLIAKTVAVSFVQERERIIRQQQEAIRELSTPVLPR